MVWPGLSPVAKRYRGLSRGAEGIVVCLSGVGRTPLPDANKAGERHHPARWNGNKTFGQNGG